MISKSNISRKYSLNEILYECQLEEILRNPFHWLLPTSSSGQFHGAVTLGSAEEDILGVPSPQERSPMGVHSGNTSSFSSDGKSKACRCECHYILGNFRYMLQLKNNESKVVTIFNYTFNVLQRIDIEQKVCRHLALTMIPKK